MPIKSKNVLQYEQFGLETVQLDIGFASAASATTHCTLPKRGTLLKMALDSQTTVSATKSIVGRLTDNGGTRVATRQIAGTNRKQTSLYEFTDTWAENDSILIGLQDPKNGVAISEEIFVSAYYLDTSSANQAAGDNFLITDTASDFGNITHTFVAGQEEAPAYMAAVAATLNADSDFSTNYYAGSVQVAPDKAFLVIYRRNAGSAAIDYTEQGTWGGTGTDITAAAAALKRAMFAAALCVRIAEENGFTIATDGTSVRLNSVNNAIAVIQGDDNNQPFNITLAVTTAGDGDVDVEQEFLLHDDAVNGIEAGDQAIIGPAAGSFEFSEDDQIELYLEDLNAGTPTVDVQAKMLIGPPVTGNKVPENGPHAEVSHASLKRY